MSSNCIEDPDCKTLFNFIYAQALTFVNTSYSESFISLDTAETLSEFTYDTFDPVELSKKIYQYPKLFTQYTNQENSKFGLQELCRCIVIAYHCDIQSEKKQTNINSNIIKNVYLILYILLILFSFGVNMLTSFLLLSEHKSLYRLVKYLFCCCCISSSSSSSSSSNSTAQKITRKNFAKNKQLRQIASLNSISDILILSLLISYVIITFYVVPYQTYLFYTESTLYNCRLPEFFKAFSVSLSIYSLVSISLQRFFAIKFSQYSCSLVNGRLIDTLSFISIFSFFRSVGILISTFLTSRSYRRYLITSILLILTWAISILIGVQNMNQYHEQSFTLKGYDFYERNMTCRFPRDLKSSARYCANKNNEDISKSDIFFVISLLVVPNLIVLTSYTWVCYHIWSTGSKLNMGSFKIYYKQNKQLETLNLQQVEPLNGTVKILNNNNNRNSNEKNSSTDSIVRAENKAKKTVRVDTEAFNKMLSTSKTQTITSYHQFSIKKRNMAVTITTFMMVVCFSVCWAPFFIFPILYIQIPNTDLYISIKVIIHMIGYSSAIWNPIILIIKSKRFKVKVSKLSKRIFCFKLTDSKVNSQSSSPVRKSKIPVENRNRQNLRNDDSTRSSSVKIKDDRI